MKTLMVHVAKEQMSQLIAETHQGDTVVLTDGKRRLTLEAAVREGGALDLEVDSPELAAELLKVAKGPFTP